MSDPLNVAPRRLVPIAGPLAWLPADLPPSEQMIPLGAEHAAELAGAGPTPRLDALADGLRPRLDHGRGFALLRGLSLGEDAAAPLQALAARLGTPVPPRPNTGSRHVEACDFLLLRVLAPASTVLRAAASLHNAILRADRAALAALYEARGEPAMPVFSHDGGVFAARWDDTSLPPDRLPSALPETLGEGLALSLRAGDILVLNPFLVWADRVPEAIVAACRASPSRLDSAAFAGLA